MFYYDLSRELFEVANINTSLITVRVSRGGSIFCFLDIKKISMCHAKDMTKSPFSCFNSTTASGFEKLHASGNFFAIFVKMGHPRGPDTGLPMELQLILVLAADKY